MELKKLVEEIAPYKNTLVIGLYDKLYRLVDVVEYEDDDIFWVLESSDGIIEVSCLIDYIPLKGFLPKEKYESLVNVWNLNNTNQVI